MILAKFKRNEYSTIACGLVQWDYGQTLRIEGVEAGDAPEVHFSVGHQEAIISIGKIVDGGIEVHIPDDLLEEGEQITAYVYIANADSGKTIRTISLPVKRRPRPDDYDSPGEQSLLRKMLEEVKGKADNIQESDGCLQLLSGTAPIGNRIRLPESGGSGREIELRNSGTAIEWRYTDSNEWTELAKISDLSGKDGDTPEFKIREGHLIAIYKN